MTSAAVRIGVGTRLVHDGELVEIVEVRTGQTGIDVVLKRDVDADVHPSPSQRNSYVRLHASDP
jgi:hypothetical protein